MGIESQNNEKLSKLSISDTEANKISFPTVFWIFKEIEISTPEEMWEKEANRTIWTNIVNLWKETAWPNRNGEYITDTDYVNSHIPNWQYFTCEQFIDIFNQKNQERIKNNNKIISSFDFYKNITNKENIKKKWWKLYINEKELTDIFKLISKQTIYEQIKDKWQFISYQEFESQINTEIIQLWTNSILDNMPEHISPKEKLINEINSITISPTWLTDWSEIANNNFNLICNTAKSFFVKMIESGYSKIKNIDTFKNQLAYILGTPKWECKFKNVSQQWSSKYRGRWFVQLTYDFNYRNFTNITRNSGFTFHKNDWSTITNDELNLLKYPDMITQSNELAAFILVYGTINWSFTWKKLDDYINDEKSDFLHARKVIWWKFAESYVKNAEDCLKNINLT